MTEITDAAGAIVEKYEYDVFGRPYVFDGAGNPLTESAIGNPYLFTGRRYDQELGLYYYRARYYAPEIGRFLSTDPLGYGDGLNLYTYCRNNPVNWVDPLGLQSEEEERPGYKKKVTGYNKYTSLPNIVWVRDERYKAKVEESILDRLLDGEVTSAGDVYRGDYLDNRDVQEAAIPPFLYDPRLIDFLNDFIQGAFLEGPPPQTPGGTLGWAVRQAWNKLGESLQEHPDHSTYKDLKEAANWAANDPYSFFRALSGLP